MSYPNVWKSLPETHKPFIWLEDTRIFRRDFLDHVTALGYRSVVAELGIGNGELILAMARRHPEIFFVGVDLYYRQLARSAKRILQGELANVQLVRFNAMHPAILFPDGFLTGVVVNFPEPWPKRKHFRHRIFYGPVAKHFRQVLVPGGWVFLQTDDMTYFRDTVALFTHDGWEVREGVYPPVMDEGFRTPFHRLFLAQGLPIYRMLATVHPGTNLECHPGTSPRCHPGSKAIRDPIPIPNT